MAVLFEPGGDVISAGNLGTNQVVIRRHAGGDGRELWRFAVSGTASIVNGASLIHDGAGDLLAALDRLLADGSQLGTIAKLDPLTGSEMWRLEIPGARLSAIAADASGDAVAVGLIEIAEYWHDTLVVKVSGETGAELWREQRSGGHPDHHAFYSVATASNGDFFVAGSLAKPRLYHNPGDYGFSVLRLRASDGAELWWQEIGDYGQVEDIAIDPNGDVVAVGDDLRSEFLAVSLRASDGALLWSTPTSLDDPQRFEGAAAVAVDPAGDVFVVGALDDPAWPDTPTTAVTTLKLAGSTGSILWRHDASNPASGGQNCCRTRDIALGPDGNPVVIGILGIYFNRDIVALKLSADTGAELWRTDPGTGQDLIGQVAIAEDGSVAVASSRSQDCLNGLCRTYTVAKLRRQSGLGFFSGCGDEVDNDGDGVVDHPEDLGCASASSPLEDPACQDGTDNDGDGRIDHPGDLGCAQPSSDTESPACQDGIDNDGDGLADYPEDLGCARPSSDTESPDCQDGIDNDYWDGLIDYPEDPGCASPSGDTESPACQDGWDNDGDGTIDFDGGVSANLGWVPIAPPDPNCARPYQNREDAAPRRCGIGVELVAALPLLIGLRARLRRRS